MKFAREESGNVLILAAMSMMVVMGALALSIDVGYVQYRQSQLQTAADAAALAAGLELGNCGKTVCSNMETAAEKALNEDGITTSTITPTVNSGSSSCSVPTSTGLAMTINVAPCALGASDPNNGNANMAEVVLTESQSTFFGRIFGISSMNLVARAEAGDAYISTAGGGNCIYTQNLEFNSSNGTFSLNSCGLYDNGNLQTNNGDSVTASSTFLYYGSWSPNNCNSSCTWNLGDGETQPTHTTTQQADPLTTEYPSTGPTEPAQSPTYNDTTPSNGATLDPGYYPNGINLNSGVTVNLTPGLYYMNGSINVDSGATIECTTCTGGAGVTLYFNNGSFQPNSSATVTLSASAAGNTTGGALPNMLIWEGSSNSSSMDLDASTSITLNGIIYLPDAELDLNSGSGSTINSGATESAIDVKNLVVNSDVTLVVNGSQSLLGGGGSGESLGAFALAE